VSYSSPQWNRVLLKLSGEAFAGGAALGIDPSTVSSIARQVADVVRGGVQVAIVVGGGNMFRGALLAQRGVDRPRADYMGMLSTVINCLALQDFLEKEGIETRVQTAITMGQVAEPYVPRRAIRHLRKVESSSSAPVWVRRSSPPTPPRRNARWRSVHRCC